MESASPTIDLASGEKAKARDIITAIKTLKTVKREQRAAPREERLRLCHRVSVQSNSMASIAFGSALRIGIFLQTSYASPLAWNDNGGARHESTVAKSRRSLQHL
jgi:hypothetical protein